MVQGFFASPNRTAGSGTFCSQLTRRPVGADSVLLLSVTKQNIPEPAILLEKGRAGRLRGIRVQKTP